MDRLLLFRLPHPHTLTSQARAIVGSFTRRFLSLDSGFLDNLDPNPGPSLLGFDYAPKHLCTAFSFLKHGLLPAQYHLSTSA